MGVNVCSGGICANSKDAVKESILFHGVEGGKWLVVGMGVWSGGGAYRN
jgi:hypothetical protein